MKWIAGILNAVAVILVLLYASVCLPVFNVGFYEAEYVKNGTYGVVAMEESDLMAVTKHMLDYMSGGEAELNIETTVNGQRRMFFSEREIIHMRDVAGLFSGGRAVFYAAMAVLILTAAAFRFFKLPSRTLGICYIVVPTFTVAAFSVIGIAFAADFNRAFTVFHEIFFNNDLWLLDPSVDLLVNIVPTAFFMDLGLLILVILITGLAIMTGSGIFIVKRRKKPSMEV